MSDVGADFSRHELQHRALRGSMWALVSVAVAAPLGLVANAIIARALGPVRFGELALLLVIYTLALQLSDFGFLQAQMQWGVGATTRGDHRGAASLLSRGLGFRLLVQLPVLLTVGIVALRAESGRAQLVWAGAVGVSTVLAGLSTALLFANRSATIARSATITSVVIHVGTVVAAIVTAAPIPVLLVRVLLAPVEWMIDGLFLDKSLRRAALHPRWPHRMPAGFWRFAGLAGLSIALQLVVFTRSEVFVFSLYGEATALGLYALAFGIAQQITAPLEGLIAPLMPAMAGLVESHRDHIARGSLRAVRLLALFTGAVVALLPAVAFSVPMIFGREFATAGALVVPLGLAAALRVVASPATVLVYALRRGKTLVAANGTALALDAALALALIPVVGVWGAVVAALAAQSASVVITSRAWLRMDEVTMGDALTAASSWLAGLLTVPLSLAAGAAVGSMVGDLAAVVVAAAVGSMSFLALARQQQAGLLMGDSPAVLGALPSASRTAVAGLLRLAGAPDVPRPTAPVAARTDLER